MPEIGLKRASIVPFVCERLAAGVAEHVRMRLERKLGDPACSLGHAREVSCRERCAALRGEYQRGLRGLIALEPPQGS
jgi:hypothetical protein